MADKIIKVDETTTSKEAQEYCNDLVCKNCACCECECNKALCSKWYFATKAFDAGVNFANKKNSDEVFYTSECYFTSKDCRYHEEDTPFGECPFDNKELMKDCPCKLENIELTEKLKSRPSQDEIDDVAWRDGC